jgi:hypothetical protein
MNEQLQERVESAILQLIAEFPGLLGPVAIQAALKKVFGMPDEKATKTGQELTFLETIGLISSQDLGNGRFVYRLTNRGAQWLGSDRVRIQLRQNSRRKGRVGLLRLPLPADGHSFNRLKAARISFEPARDWNSTGRFVPSGS